MSETVVSYGTNGVNILSPAPAAGSGGALLMNNDKALSDAIDHLSTKYLSLSGGAMTGPLFLSGNPGIPAEIGPSLGNSPNHGVNMVVFAGNSIGTTGANVGGNLELLAGTSLYGAQGSVTTNNNTLDDGYGNMVINNASSGLTINMPNGNIGNGLTINDTGSGDAPALNLNNDLGHTVQLNIGGSTYGGVADGGGFYWSTANGFQFLQGNVNGSPVAPPPAVLSFNNDTSVHTLNNTLDDGSGTMTFANQLSGSANVGVVYFDTYTNLHLGDSGSSWNIVDDHSGSSLFVVNSSAGSSGMPYSVTTLNNTLDDGAGDMTITGTLECYGGILGYGSVSSAHNTLDDGGGNMDLGGKLNGKGFTTYDSTIKTGSLEFQPYALNNGFIGENCYYNGSGFVYRATGAAGLFYFQGSEGQFRFTTSGTAGASASLVYCQFKVNANGTVALGGSIDAATNGSTTGATLVVTSSGATVTGSLAATTVSGGYINTIATKTSAYTLTTSDSVVLVNSASNIVMTLPSASTATAGREYTIKTINSAATVKTSGSGQKIDGTDYSSSGYALSGNNKYITVVSDGSANWYIVANN